MDNKSTLRELLIDMESRWMITWIINRETSSGDPLDFQWMIIRNL